MRIPDTQTGPQAPQLLHTLNTSTPALSPFNNPLQFSDATPSPQINRSDPRHLIAIMTQTRHQCRPKGLIKRDHSELTHIAQNQGISKAHTQKIIQLVQSSTTLSNHQLETLETIPINQVHKKTRIPIRVLIGLSIWAITIVIAMQMVQQSS